MRGTPHAFAGLITERGMWRNMGAFRNREPPQADIQPGTEVSQQPENLNDLGSGFPPKAFKEEPSLVRP